MAANTNWIIYPQPKYIDTITDNANSANDDFMVGQTLQRSDLRNARTTVAWCNRWWPWSIATGTHNWRSWSAIRCGSVAGGFARIPSVGSASFRAYVRRCDHRTTFGVDGGALFAGEWKHFEMYYRIYWDLIENENISNCIDFLYWSIDCIIGKAIMSYFNINFVRTFTFFLTFSNILIFIIQKIYLFV